MAGNIEAVFGIPAYPSRADPDLRHAYDSGRGQYNSTTLITTMTAAPIASGGKAVLLVDVDLFVPVLTHVFGEAQFEGTAAIVSTHRLADQFYGLPARPGILARRIEKELIHELGHTFGLYHCHQFECVMRSSTYVGEIDLKRATPCPECSARLLAMRDHPEDRTS